MKYLILGAGPAGLSFANILMDEGENSFIVLEKETTPGGLCRSVDVDNSPFDIGGGHFLDVRRPKVCDYLFRFMPESEWRLFNRDSRIELYGKIINHPIEANIWQLEKDQQVKYLKSIAIAGCNLGKEKPSDFIEWIYWKLGNLIAEDYMLPYNQKMFGEDLNQLGTYWLEKLPNVSFEETLLSCLDRKAYGTQPGHAQFYYPKNRGYGEVWSRMAERIAKHVEYGKSVCQIDFNKMEVKTSDGEAYHADNIITTIPWMEFDNLYGMPVEIQDDIHKLKYSSVQTSYFSDDLDTKAQWIYYPDPKLTYHRILVRRNFCTDGKGYWTETNSDRVDGSYNGEFSYVNKYAYPLNTTDKPVIMERLLGWSETHNVFGLGRWGEHQHYNSDLTVELAMNLAEKLQIGTNHK